jgi:high-affinity iron transporter
VIQAFTIMLREGVESFIVVAIIVTYLIKTDRRALLPAAWAGVGAALLATVYGTYLLNKFGENTLQEGIMCLVAAALTGTMVVWMWKTGRHLRKDIETRIDRASSNTKQRLITWPALGVFLAAFFLIAREGAEAAFLLVSLVRTTNQEAALGGAALGLLLSFGMGALWIQNSKRMNLKMFFQVTGVFLLIFVAQLLLAGIHELAEAGVIPYATPIHNATEPWVEQGAIAQWITLVMVLIPGVWLVMLTVRHSLAPQAKVSGTN